MTRPKNLIDKEKIEWNSVMSNEISTASAFLFLTSRRSSTTLDFTSGIVN